MQSLSAGTECEVPPVANVLTRANLPWASAGAVLLLIGLWGIDMAAHAIPDVIRRIELSCASCYLGGFGPPVGPDARRLGQAESATIEAGRARQDEVARWLALNDTIQLLGVMAPEFSPAPAAIDVRFAIWNLWTAEFGLPGSVPYRRVGVERDLERYFIQIGPYEGAVMGIRRERIDRFLLSPGSTTNEVLSGYIAASSPGAGFNTQDTFRAIASWSIADTVTPSIQYLSTGGFGGVGGRLNGAGAIAFIDYAPWDGLQSPMHFLAIRIGARYTAYTEFNGTARGSGSNNAVSLSLSGALHF